MEHIVETISPIIVSTLELIGVLIIAIGSCKALYFLFLEKFQFSSPRVKITLGEALSLSLEFKLGAEIIKTVVIRTLNELIILAFVVFLRVLLTFVIHWEVKHANENETELSKNYKESQ